MPKFYDAFMIFLYRKVNHQQHENVTRSLNHWCNSCNCAKKRNPSVQDKTRNAKNEKIPSEESNSPDELQGSCCRTTFDIHGTGYVFPTIYKCLQCLTSDIGVKFRRLFFKFSSKKRLLFYISRPQQAKINHVRFFL